MPTPAEIKIIEVRFESPEQLEKAYTDNIAKGGFFVPSPEPAARTTPVELRFHLPGVSESLKICGEVAYAATPEAPMPGLGPGMAIQFQGITPQIAEAFKAAIMIAKIEGMGEGSAAGEESEGTAWDEESACPMPGEDEPPAGAEDASGETEPGAEPDEVTANQIMTQLNNLSTENLYLTVRKLPHYHKITAAKRGNRAVRALLIQEGNKQIMTFLLQNPQITPAEVVTLLKMTNLPLEVIQLISKNSQWNQNEEIKYFLTVNPKTPLPLALTLLNSLSTPNIARIAKAGLKIQLKSNALKMLEARRKKGAN